MSAAQSLSMPRTLGRWDLVLLKVVAIVNINNVPPVAVYGRASLLLWVLAFVTFFVPEAVAVMFFARRYPGEGGIYLWTRREFGQAHGFLSGWCYWTNNLFYVPVLLVYMAGILAFAGGASHAADLVNQKIFVAAISFKASSAPRAMPRPTHDNPAPKRLKSGSRAAGSPGPRP